MKMKFGLCVLTVSLLFLFSVSYTAVSGAVGLGKADKAGVLEAYGKLPLYFIENKGQLDPKVKFHVKTSGRILYFTDQGIVFELLRGGKKPKRKDEGFGKNLSSHKGKTERLVFSLVFENAKKGYIIEGLELQDASVNYFVGNDSREWKRNIPTYKGVVYREVYTGIDLKVFGSGKDIEYEFIVNTGGNPDDILLTYNGIEKLTTNGEGELLISTALGELKEMRPQIYQNIKGKQAVDGSFEIRNRTFQSPTAKFSYGFQIAPYDPSYPIIIDPTLSFSTYLGGDVYDRGYDIAVDSSGSAYVAGETNSSNFPTKNAYQVIIGADEDYEYDAFISKFSSSGSLVYSTFLGGNGDKVWDTAHGIAVDSLGSAYVTGATKSSDFPTENAYQTNKSGGYDAFVTKLSPSGNALSYSTYLGGSANEDGLDIAIDGAGNAYITGGTRSKDFPTKDPYQATLCGSNWDAFVTKLSPSGNALSYSTYLGGSNLDEGSRITVDGSGNAYITGFTYSNDFPTKDPYQATLCGSKPDAFITKLSSSGNALSYSTYLGGSDDDKAEGIAVDGSGNAYITGYTYSNDFPTKKSISNDLQVWWVLK